MRKRIAFKPHETRGHEIIKILENMGGVNKYNLDGSKGIIAIDNLSTKLITNDWDYCGLIMNGWKVYTLEEYEKLEKTAENFAVDALTEKRDCHFDELDVEIVAEAYIAGYDECNQNRCLETKPKPKFKVGDKIKHKCDKNNTVITITGSKYDYYYIQYYNNIKNEYQNEAILFTDQDKYEMVERLVEEETKPKMVNLDDVCNWVENHIFDFPWYDNEYGDFSSKDIANALRKAMEE